MQVDTGSEFKSPSELMMPDTQSKENHAVWIPFAYHAMLIGVETENAVLHVPMACDVLLQQVPTGLRKAIVDYKCDELDNADQDGDSELVQEAKRWFGRSR